VLAKHLRTVRNITKLIVHGESIGRVQDPLLSVSVCAPVCVLRVQMEGRSFFGDEYVCLLCLCSCFYPPQSLLEASVVLLMNDVS
jgi:hypothetical protein